MSDEQFKQAADSPIEVTYSGTDKTYLFTLTGVLNDPIARMLWELIEEFERLRRDYEWMHQQPPTTTTRLLVLHVSGKLDGLRQSLNTILPVLGAPYLKAGDAAM